MVLPVRRRIHCGIGRFCFCALASFCFVRKDLWDCGSVRSVENRNELDRKGLAYRHREVFAETLLRRCSLWRVVVMLADFVWEVLARLGIT